MIDTVPIATSGCDRLKVSGLQAQDFTSVGLLFQLAVAHLNNCTKRYLVNNVSHLFLTLHKDKFE